MRVTNQAGRSLSAAAPKQPRREGERVGRMGLWGCLRRQRASGRCGAHQAGEKLQRFGAEAGVRGGVYTCTAQGGKAARMLESRVPMSPPGPSWSSTLP